MLKWNASDAIMLRTSLSFKVLCEIAKGSRQALRTYIKPEFSFNILYFLASSESDWDILYFLASSEFGLNIW